MTPAEISICLKFHYLADPMSEIKGDPHYLKGVFETLRRRELIAWDDRAHTFVPGPALPVYIDSLCKLPVPVKTETYIIPKE